MALSPRQILRPSHLPSSTCLHQQQIRHASLLRRPLRPYTFTQLIQLSDGSTYLTRTTSPAPVFKSTKDVRNHPLWQPSLDSLRNAESDEAGKLRAFRERFGMGWEMEVASAKKDGDKKEKEKQGQDSLMDLISGGGGHMDVGSMKGNLGRKVKEKK